MSFIKIHPLDNVAIALEPVQVGTSHQIGGISVTVSQSVPQGHKLALTDIPKDADVIKYGVPIGHATNDIKCGEHVHTHNLKTNLSGKLEYSYNPALPRVTPHKPESFQGFRRKNGKAGVRNEVWIIPTVGCVNSVAQIMSQRGQSLLRGSVEGLYSFPHPYGCSQLGDDHEMTKKALAGLINHPNAGAVLVLGLGCENNTVSGMQELLGHGDTERVKFLICQEHEDEIGAALELLKELINYASTFEREGLLASELIIGLKCGGSDGFSGITANPLVGAFSDRLTAEGGTAILTEVPEMFGAETQLMSRCADSGVFDETVKLINDFKDYYSRHGQPVYENPSPGNKDGGITTLEEKSLGCTQKGGSAVVTDVLAYGQSVKTTGLNLLESPGNDLVASTALAVCGAQIVLFTTGRGTPFGAPVPTVKISSNSDLASRKHGWIDFDAGRLLSGVSMEELSEELYRYVLKLASGDTQTRTEQQGLREIAIFKNGVTL